MWEHDLDIWSENFADFPRPEQVEVLKAAQDAVCQARKGWMTEEAVRRGAHQLLSIAGMLGFTMASKRFRDIEQSTQIDQAVCRAFEEMLVAFEAELECLVAWIDSD